MTLNYDFWASPKLHWICYSRRQSLRKLLTTVWYWYGFHISKKWSQTFQVYIWARLPLSRWPIRLGTSVWIIDTAFYSEIASQCPGSGHANHFSWQWDKEGEMKEEGQEGGRRRWWRSLEKPRSLLATQALCHRLSHHEDIALSAKGCPGRLGRLFCRRPPSREASGSYNPACIPLSNHVLWADSAYSG